MTFPKPLDWDRRHVVDSKYERLSREIDRLRAVLDRIAAYAKEGQDFGYPIDTLFKIERSAKRGKMPRVR